MRVQGWEKRLADYFDLQKDRPFEWGKNDCILFSAHAVALVLDRDIDGEVLGYGDYDKERALDILKRHGGKISGILDNHFARKENKKLVCRGDIATVLDGETEATGIVFGKYVVCKTYNGLKYVPVEKITTVWSVE